MIIPPDESDYSVVVKRRAGPPKPWRWEIYRAGKANAVNQSAMYFETMAAASKAGKKALREFLAKLQAEYQPPPLA